MSRSVDVIELELALTQERLEELQVEMDALTRKEDLLAHKAEDLFIELDNARHDGEDEE